MNNLFKNEELGLQIRTVVNDDKSISINAEDTAKGGKTMFYTIKEVAKLLNFKERTVRQWLTDDKIKGIKIFGEWRIPKEEIERLIKGE